MTIEAKFVHTNLIACDWKRLASFYEKVFGCLPLPPERDLSGEWLEQGTGVANARIRGIHLALPGYEKGGPTLEIFQYSNLEEKPETVANRPGYTHIAFSVDSVQAARDAVIQAGGRDLGRIVTHEIPDAGKINFTYMTDPEGNIIELQQWT
jgi:predicted enzyme related to lactoylglutathione lyase